MCHSLSLVLFLSFRYEFKYHLLSDSQLGGDDLSHNLKAPYAFLIAFSSIRNYIVTGVVI